MTLSEYYAKYPGTEETANNMLADAQKEFGPEAEVFIKLYVDPEIDDKYPLVLVRLPDYRTPGIMDRIDDIWERHEKIRLDNCQEDELAGWVQINTDFRPPRS